MSHLNIKKLEEQNSQKVRDLLRLPENKKCFDCPTKSPFFVNVSIQTFVCTRCSGLVREVGHRVKSISASKFSGPEIVALEHGGNEVARTIWLSKYNMTTVDPETDGDVRLFMRQKYYEQKWLDRKKGIQHAEQVKRIITEMYSEDGTVKKSVTNRRPSMQPTQSWVDDNMPIGLIPSVKNNMDDLLLKDDFMLSPKSPTVTSIPSPITSTFPQSPSASAFAQPPKSPTFMGNNATATISTVMNKTTINTTKNDIFSDLAELAPPTPKISSPTYSGGILQPLNNPPLTSSTPITTTNTVTTPTTQKPISSTPIKSNSFADLDPYAALRDLSIGSKSATTNSSAKPFTSLNTLKNTSNNDIWGDFQKSPTEINFIYK